MFTLKNIAVGLMVSGGLLLITGIITALFTKSVKPIYVVAITSAVGALIVMSGAVATLFKEINSSETQKAIRATGESTNSEVKALKTKNEELEIKASASLELIQSQRQAISVLQSQNAELSEKANKIYSRAVDLHGNMTGGDSFCYLDLGFTLGGSPTGQVKLIGKNALNTIKMEISRVPRDYVIREVSFMGTVPDITGMPNYLDGSKGMTAQILKGIDPIWGYVNVELLNIDIDYSTLKYLIRFSSGNGKWIQLIQVDVRPNTMDKYLGLYTQRRISTQVYRQINDVIEQVFEYNFPD